MMREDANCKVKRSPTRFEPIAQLRSGKESCRLRSPPYKIFGTFGDSVGYGCKYWNFIVKYLPDKQQEVVMGLGRGALLWLIGVPLPVIILIALFWHH